MRLVKKLGPDRYIEHDSDSGRIMTVEMTRNELYSHLLRGTWEDMASFLVEDADRKYDEESKQQLHIP